MNKVVLINVTVQATGPEASNNSTALVSGFIEFNEEEKSGAYTHTLTKMMTFLLCECLSKKVS